MTDQEFQIAVIAIVFGSAVAVAIVVTIGIIINSWIKRKSGSNLAENEEFLEALRQFKQKTDRRLSKIETMLDDKSETFRKKRTIQPADNPNTIEIDKEKEEEKTENSGSNLKNMLKE